MAVRFLLVTSALAMSVRSSSALAMARSRKRLSATASSWKVLWMCSLRRCLVVNCGGGTTVSSSLLLGGGSGQSSSTAEVSRRWKLLLIVLLDVLEDELEFTIGLKFFFRSTILQPSESVSRHSESSACLKRCRGLYLISISSHTQPGLHIDTGLFQKHLLAG